MSTKNKKVAVLFLLFLGSLPWIFILFFYIHRGMIRHEMKEKLEKNIPLHTVVIPDNDIHWVKTGKEIWVNGKMFDIKTISRDNGVTTFTGLYDDEETALEEKLNDQWRRNSNQETQAWSRLLNTFQNLFFELNSQSPVAHAAVCTVYEAADEELAWLYRHIPTPPPRC